MARPVVADVSSEGLKERDKGNRGPGRRILSAFRVIFIGFAALVLDLAGEGRKRMMKVELSKEGRAAVLASLQRYFEENMPEPIGNLAAGTLLDFFLEEVGPAVYNQAIADAQARMLARVGDLSGELFGDEFQYWPRVDSRRKARR